MAVERKAVSTTARAAGRARGFSGIARFFREVAAELQKVAWPSRQDIVKLTMVVLLAIGVFAIYIYVLDIGVGSLTKPLFRSITK